VKEEDLNRVAVENAGIHGHPDRIRRQNPVESGKEIPVEIAVGDSLSRVGKGLKAAHATAFENGRVLDLKLSFLAIRIDCGTKCALVSGLRGTEIALRKVKMQRTENANLKKDRSMSSILRGRAGHETGVAQVTRRRIWEDDGGPEDCECFPEATTTGRERLATKLNGTTGMCLGPEESGVNNSQRHDGDRNGATTLRSDRIGEN
jgi:hypothetical protein